MQLCCNRSNIMSLLTLCVHCTAKDIPNEKPSLVKTDIDWPVVPRAGEQFEFPGLISGGLEVVEVVHSYVSGQEPEIIITFHADPHTLDIFVKAGWFSNADECC